MGVITTASFAKGVALIIRYRHFNRNFDVALFGNILGVSQSDVWVVAGVMLMIAVIIFFLYTTFGRNTTTSNYSSQVKSILTSNNYNKRRL
jgi:ABC-type Mn2+/Zn2+ transport system permease subunit